MVTSQHFRVVEAVASLIIGLTVSRQPIANQDTPFEQ
jgi:hypothetical protein